MPRFGFGDKVRLKDTTPELDSRTGTIIDISYFSEDPMPPGDHVLQFEDGSLRRFTGDEIEPNND